MLEKSVLVVALLLIATNLWAAKTMDVSATRHNLSSTSVNIPGGNMYMASNEDEVCIFCHTPHGGTANTPLWNRALPTGAFTHYTSATLSPNAFVGGVNRAVSAESLLCMSCHDGAVAMNSIINNSNRTVGGTPNNTGNIVNQIFTTGGAIGDIMNPSGIGTQGQSRNLSDDHPISFSYYEAVADPENNGKLNAVGGGADPMDDGIRFFGNLSTEQRVECSSCHDPHVNYEAFSGDVAYTPFLVTPNAGSALCLACHIK